MAWEIVGKLGVDYCEFFLIFGEVHNSGSQCVSLSITLNSIVCVLCQWSFYLGFGF